MGTVVKSKVVLKDLGEPAAVKLLPEGQDKFMLGTIVGIADRIKLAKLPDGVTTTEGLKGTFEAVPADPAKDTVRSGVCFLGEAFQADILALLKQEDGPDSVSFAYEVWVVKAKNPAGYQWALAPLMKAEEADPLAAMRALLKKPEETAKLAAPKADAKK